MDKSVSKKPKRKLRVSGLLFLFLGLYLVVMLLYYFFAMPIKNITVSGLNILEEKTVLEAGNINDKTPIFKVHKRFLKRKLLDIPLVDSCNIKVSLNGKVEINIKESKILFIDSIKNEYVLSNGKTFKNNNEYTGYPILVNEIPKKLREKTIEQFSKIDENIIPMISQIEYSPDIYQENIIDAERYILVMNDGNEIYINLVNIKKINKYQTIYDNIGTGGVLYLDSSSDTYIFRKYA